MSLAPPRAASSTEFMQDPPYKDSCLRYDPGVLLKIAYSLIKNGAFFSSFKFSLASETRVVR